MRRTFYLAVLLFALGACTPAQADKGGVPHEGSNGRGAQGAPPPEQNAAPQGKTDDARPPSHKAKHKTKDEPPEAKAKQPKAEQHPAASPQTAPAPSKSHGQHKTTICHRTGSSKNPWVEITVADPALKAHRAHGDLIPAPAGGCPKPQAAAAPEQSAATTAPASPGTPPAATNEAASTVVPTPTSSPTAPAHSTPQPAGATGAVLDTTASSPARHSSDAAGGRVLAAHVSSPTASGTAAADDVAPAAARDTGSGLPFTGSPAWLVLLMGAGAVLAGVSLRRSRFGRR